MDMSFSRFQELVMDREAWRAAVLQKVRHDWATELNWISLLHDLNMENLWFTSESKDHFKEYKTDSSSCCLRKLKCLHTELIVVVIQLFSRVWLFATPWTTALQASLSFTISQSLLKLMSIELMMLSDHFILCCPLLLLPSTVFQILLAHQQNTQMYMCAKLL